MSQSSLSSSLVTFSWNLENWKTSTWETKNLIAIKLSIVDCISHFLFEGAKIISKCYSEFWIDIILIDIRKLFNWIQINMIFKRSCSVFTKKVFLKIFAEFTWKHLRSATLIQETPVQVFSCEMCKIFKNLFFTEQHLITAFGFFCSYHGVFLWLSELIETRFFLFLNMFYHNFSTWWTLWTLHLENFTLWNNQPNCWCMGTHIFVRFHVGLSGVF